MNAGDEFLATIRVYYTGQNTCGGGREFEDVANAVHNFDEGDFDNLVPVPKALPTKVGSLIRIDYHDGSGAVFAMLRDGGGWITTRLEETLRVLSPADLRDTTWTQIV